jgi:hypothetical protein
MQRDVAGLKEGTDANGELCAAVTALAQADARFLQVVDALRAAAVRADRAMRPQKHLYLLKGGGFVVEVWLAQNANRAPLSLHA